MLSIHSLLRIWSIVIATTAMGAAHAVTANIVTNGTFAAGLTNWTGSVSTTGSAAGTCGFNGDTAPGTENGTGTPGFPATTGTEEALGNASLNAVGFMSCVLYQDVTIPAGATAISISMDSGMKLLGGLPSGDTAIFVGLYPTGSVPDFPSNTFLGGNRLIVGGAAATPNLVPKGPVVLTTAGLAGTTARLAIIIAVQSTSSGTGPPTVGGFSVIGVNNVRVQVTSPDPVVAGPIGIPTLSEWGVIILSALMAVLGFVVMRNRRH